MSPSRELFLPLIRVQHLHTTRIVLSGHNRWSKIKHDKAKVDGAKHRQRSIFASEIATASRLYGPDPNANPRLAFLITNAKREGFAKTSIEAAIARGQGRSTTGAALENVTIEALLPNNVGLIVECETDSRGRTLQQVRLAIKTAGGTTTPSSFLFDKKGRVVFEEKDGVTSVEALDAALDAGAIDIDEQDGKIVVFTEPEQTRSVGDALSKALKLDISTSDIIWDPKQETLVELPSPGVAQDIVAFIDDLQEKETTVQALAMNVSQGVVDEDTWKALQARIAV